MTIDAVRRKSNRMSRREHEQPDELPIGETDANIFECPVCTRPLAVGTRRCPGCSTRLLAGIRATRALGFIAVGVLIGALVGGTGVGVAAALLAAPSAAVMVQTDSVVTPSGAPVPSAAVPAAPVVDPTVPAAALTALRQSALINQRLTADAVRLKAALAADPPTSVDIARALRALSATAAFGDRIAPDVAAWAAAGEVSSGFEAFYDAVGSTARDGLASSLQNRAAYVRAGRAMLAVMGRLPALDAAARDLATTAGVVDLPALTGSNETSTAP
jgi:hypothetical protein